MSSSTNIISSPRSAIASSPLSRGVRVILNASGLVEAAGSVVRGDYATVHDIPSGEPGLVASMSAGGSIPLLVAMDVIDGDPAYAAIDGLATGDPTDAAYIGKFLSSGSAGELVAVELQSEP